MEAYILNTVLGFTILLLIWFVVFLVGSNLLPEDTESVVIGLGVFLYKSARLKGFIQRLSMKGSQIWHFLANTAVLVSVGGVFLALGLFSINAFRLLTKPQQAIGIVPVIPGVTIPVNLFIFGFLPLAIVAIFIHEFSHGITALIEKISIKSAGFAIFLFFLGGFVEPDDKDLAEARPHSRMKVYAAGSFSNLLFAIGLLVLLLPLPFFLTISPAYESPDGIMIVGLSENGPAELAGIQVGDVITTFNGIAITNEKEMSDEYIAFYSQNRANSKSNTTILLEIQNRGFLEVQSGSYGFLGIGYMTHYTPRGWADSLGFTSYGPYRIRQFLFLAQILNFIVALVNLLPIPFLDGHKLMGTFFDEVLGENRGKIVLRALASISLFLLLFNMIFTFLNPELIGL